MFIKSMLHFKKTYCCCQIVSGIGKYLKSETLVIICGFTVTTAWTIYDSIHDHHRTSLIFRNYSVTLNSGVKGMTMHECLQLAGDSNSKKIIDVTDICERVQRNKRTSSRGETTTDVTVLKLLFRPQIIFCEGC